MPAGLSWSRYMRFFTAAMLSMFAGSQMMHIYYRPLEDMDAYLEEERKIAQIIKDKHSS